MIEVIKSPTPVTEKSQWTVFLAGPMNGAPSWQAQAPKMAAKAGIDNVTFLNPRKTERFVSGTYQVNWETFGLRMCDVILFWIPPQARPMSERRIYAITTRLEMAENLRSLRLPYLHARSWGEPVRRRTQVMGTRFVRRQPIRIPCTAHRMVLVPFSRPISRESGSDESQ